MTSKDHSGLKEDEEIPKDFKEITGFDTPAERAAYEQGVSDHEKTMMEFITKWDGSTNSHFGQDMADACKRNIEPKEPQVSNWKEEDMKAIWLEGRKYGSFEQDIYQQGYRKGEKPMPYKTAEEWMKAKTDAMSEGSDKIKQEQDWKEEIRKWRKNGGLFIWVLEDYLEREVIQPLELQLREAKDKKERVADLYKANRQWHQKKLREAKQEIETEDINSKKERIKLKEKLLKTEKENQKLRNLLLEAEQNNKR